MLSTLNIVPWVASFALLFVGCAADSSAGSRDMPSATAGAAAGRAPQGAAGSGSGNDFGNAPVMMTPQAGAASAPPVMRTPQSSCKGGQYRGRYTCDLEVFGIPTTLEGDVSFMLEIDETRVPGNCQEFCPDLVIAEGSGTLFGVAGDTGWAFEAKLDGGLDCQKGEFRATAPNGIYGLAGSDDAANPNAITTVLDPALGNFDGMLTGKHSGPPERIAGDWDLTDVADLARCTGPFMVELQ